MRRCAEEGTGQELREALDGAITRFVRRLAALFDEALRAQVAPGRHVRDRPRRRSAQIAVRAMGPQPWPANTNGAALLDELGRYAESEAFGQLGAPLVVALMTASVLMTRPPPRGAAVQGHSGSERPEQP